MTFARASLFALGLFVSTACGQARSSAPEGPLTLPEARTPTIAYVGNEGVFISDGTKAVLIDGLHRKYGDAYLFPPPELLAAMEQAKPPFDQVRVLLVSHVHGDHFHPESVAQHLRNNPKATLVSDAQKASDIARNYSAHESVRTQVHEATPEWKEMILYEKDGIRVKLLGMKHGTERHWWIKNLGHIVEIGGKKFFHFGDADMTDENFAAFDLPAEKIDVAFVPYWFLLSEDGRRIVRERIAARSVIAVHISPANAEADAARIKQFYPGADAFTKMLETRPF
jgi:L-ascorbate metabolism protein UlaG (beta-lactamase superfamily)